MSEEGAAGPAAGRQIGDLPILSSTGSYKNTDGYRVIVEWRQGWHDLVFCVYSPVDMPWSFFNGSELGIFVKFGPCRLRRISPFLFESVELLDEEDDFGEDLFQVRIRHSFQRFFFSIKCTDGSAILKEIRKRKADEASVYAYKSISVLWEGIISEVYRQGGRWHSEGPIAGGRHVA